MTSDAPAGFQLLAAMDGVTHAFAPLYARTLPDGQMILGFRVGPQHCNPRGMCHGGTWATMADILMGVNVGIVTGLSGPTVSMALDYLGAGGVGQWIEGTARVLRQTARLGFADCLFTADGAAALRANAVFRRKLPLVHPLETLLAAGAGHAG